MIDGVIAGVGGTGNHNEGTGGCNGGTPVQLMPYDDTPNNGGEYSVDMAPAGRRRGVRWLQCEFDALQLPRLHRLEERQLQGEARGDPDPDADADPDPDADADPDPDPEADRNAGRDPDTDR